MGEFDFAKPAAKKGAAKKAAPTPPTKSSGGGGFDPSVFLKSGVPSTGTGPKAGASPVKGKVDAARSAQQARQKELRGKTMKKHGNVAPPFPTA